MKFISCILASLFFLLPQLLLAQDFELPIETLIDQADDYHSTGIKFDEINPQKAIENYQYALEIRKGLYFKKNIKSDNILEGIIKGYFNIGDSWLDLGDFEKSEKYLDSCRLMQKQLKELFYSDRRWGQLNHGLGKLYKSIAGYQATLEAFQSAHLHYGISEKSVTWRARNQGHVFNDISALMIKWEMPADSILKYAQKANRIYEEIMANGEGGYLLFKIMPNAKINEGTAYELLGDFGKANQSYEAALEMLEELKDMVSSDMQATSEDDRDWHIDQFVDLVKSFNMAYNGIGISLRRQGEYKQAIEYFEKAIDLNNWLAGLNPEAKQSDILLTRAHHNLAEVYYDQQQYQKALDENQLALNLIVNGQSEIWDANDNPKIEEERFYVLDNIYFIKTLLAKAACQRALGDRSAALATADLGIAYIYQIRKNYLDQESRFQLADNMKALTELIIDIYLNQAKPEVEKAFSYAEKNKIFTLLEAVKDHKSLQVLGVDNTLLEREKSIRKQIAYTTQLLAKNRSDSAKADLMTSLYDLKKSLSKILDQLDDNDNYRKLFVGATPIEVREIKQKNLAKDQALIEYFVGQKATYAFVIPSSGKIQVVTIDIQEDQLNKQVDTYLTAMLNSYQKELSQTKQVNQTTASTEWYAKQLLIIGQGLYHSYFSPILDLIEAKRFVIIPDGALNKIPFSALIQPDKSLKPGAYHSYHFLGHSYAISYCYAATLFAEMNKTISTREQHNHLLAFAPSFLGNVQAPNTGFSSLRFNKQEVRAINEIFSSNIDPLINNEARKEAFMKLVSNGSFDFVHLATHGKADYHDPNNSLISFSQLDPSGIDESQLLYLRELYNLELAIETIVLSSCETNFGPVHRAGGMLSLTRGFAFAGVKSIISSLWEVNESSTKELMINFYKNLDQGMDKDIALQQAKLSLQSNGDFRHPYYWAAFIPVGKTAIKKDGDNTRYWVAGGLLIAISGLLLRRRKKSV